MFLIYFNIIEYVKKLGINTFTLGYISKCLNVKQQAHFSLHNGITTFQPHTVFEMLVVTD